MEFDAKVFAVVSIKCPNIVTANNEEEAAETIQEKLKFLYQSEGVDIFANEPHSSLRNGTMYLEQIRTILIVPSEIQDEEGVII
jgi:hypothetical protein